VKPTLPSNPNAASSGLTERVSAALADTYAFERELEGGGMSRVFVAEDRNLGRKVVVKVLPPELAAGVSGERFRREILTVARLQHPHIVTVLRTGEVDGLPYFVMPYVEGESLAVRIARKKTLGVRETVGIVKDVARALAFAHERGIIHRDIKPGNVLLSSGSATVTDFGVAKALVSSRYSSDSGSSPLTNTGISLGTLMYMAPEQVAGDPDTDGRADIYSLGVTAYEMLTGAPPFAELGPRGMLAARLSRAPIPLSAVRLDVPPGLEALIMRCLATDPAHRLASADALIDALEDPALLAGAPAASGELLRARALPGRRTTMIGFAILAAAAVVIWLAGRPAEAAGGINATPASNSGSVEGLVIAVLPFVGLGSDTSDTYVATGLTNAVAGKLTRISGMRIIAPSRAVVYAAGNPRDAARNSLRASFVLEGTVEREGNHVRVTASLTSTEDGVMQWADVFDRSSSDLFQVEDQIAAAIVEAVSPSRPAMSELRTNKLKAGS
jgi:TolB-like protein/tRNA A-37 threonylcarbamoyl transferase component Bud32